MNDYAMKIKAFEDVILGKNEILNLLGINKNIKISKTRTQTTCNFSNVPI